MHRTPSLTWPAGQAESKPRLSSLRASRPRLKWLKLFFRWACDCYHYDNNHRLAESRMIRLSDTLWRRESCHVLLRDVRHESSRFLLRDGLLQTQPAFARVRYTDLLQLLTLSVRSCRRSVASTKYRYMYGTYLSSKEAFRDTFQRSYPEWVIVVQCFVFRSKFLLNFHKNFPSIPAHSSKGKIKFDLSDKRKNSPGAGQALRCPTIFVFLGLFFFKES